MHDAREYTLAEIADAAAMTERNVRAYQSRGLLPPTRRQGRRTLYGPDHVARLRLVRALHQHGLTLRLIGDLVERGTADAELARLARDELSATWGKVLRVPMSTAIVERYERDHPGGIQALLDAGLVARHGDRVLASATSLGIVSALGARGVDVPESARVSLCAARAAHRCAPELRDVVDEVVGSSDADADEVTMLVVQLAASAYADVLTRYLAPPARTSRAG